VPNGLRGVARRVAGFDERTPAIRATAFSNGCHRRYRACTYVLIRLVSAKAHEVARALDAPLDVFLVRTPGVNGHRELAMEAIASGGVRILNGHVITAYRIPEAARTERDEHRS
jgi:predicted phosphoribosyltransferase